MGRTADVLDAVGIGESQVAIEPVPGVVAIEQERVLLVGGELLLEQVGNGRFAGA